ncbi:MAG: hypothetical protein K9M80_06685 [Candidatus Marinimicrobia bacterium]|nr:hypothetical protein [Candidatus Neomarinimicrobiota bacterium]
MNGLRISIPGDGNIYISGHTNNMFNKRRIYHLESNTLKEIKQPFYYVGQEGVLQKDITLYRDQDNNIPVIKLKKR